MIDSLNKNEIHIPSFQRNAGVWDKFKVEGWINTIISQKAIGVIVTYQIDGSGPIYLLDGLQRLTATNKFLEDPSYYGFDFGKIQARSFCEAFNVTNQHRHYKNPEEAMEHFQNINKGTSLTEREFHKGTLTLDKCGDIINRNVPGIINRYFSEFLSNRMIGRQAQSKFERDDLALYFQYLSKSKAKTFWDASRSKSHFRGIPIEKRIIDHIKENKLNTELVEETISAFERYVAQEAALIREIIISTNQTGKSISPTFLRALLHLALYRKNSNDITKERYEEFITALLEYQKNNKSITSRFVTPMSDPITQTTLRLNDIGVLFRLANKFGIVLESKRIKQPAAAAGYDNSHKLPFSKYGEGETFPEPAGRNRSRGANQVNEG